MLIAAGELGTDDEPLWLTYDPTAEDPASPESSISSILPAALDFEAVLALHLTGISIALAAAPDVFRRILPGISKMHGGSMREPLRWTIAQAEKAALAVRHRTDVRAPNVRFQKNHAIVATLGQVRRAELLASEAPYQKWLSVPFVAAHFDDVKRTKALMKAVNENKLKATTQATNLLKNVGAEMIAFSGAEPSFVKGSVDDFAQQLRGLGFPVLVPDEFGDVANFASLADGAAHVLDRIEQIRAAL
jgi:hypothetical protein